jgi:superfamily II DNA or RNA helicase
MQLTTPPKERTLRPYQKDLKDGIYEHYKNGVKSVLCIATGGLGKTTLAAWIMRDRSVRAKNPARSIFLVERNCLLDQTAKTLASLGVDCSVIQGNRKIDWNHPCMVASLQTLRSWSDGGKDLKKKLGNVGMFVLDEAHKGVGHRAYKELCELYADDKKCVFLGLSASPWRMNREEYLGQWFEASVSSLQPPEAIKAGWLCQSRNFSRNGIFDLSQVGTQSDGDYSEVQLGKQAMRPEALQLVVDEWKLWGEDKPTLCFCSNAPQAKAQRDCFIANGIPADIRLGGTSRDDRTQQDKNLSSGKTKVVCSIGTMDTGYDLPCIATIVYAKATKSRSGFYQAVWRGCRPFPGKDYFTVLDFGGNLELHGNPMGYQDYYISEPRARAKPEESSMNKECPKCHKEVGIFLKVCSCGHVFGEEDGQEELFDPALYRLKEWFDPIGCEQVQFLRSEKARCYRANESPDLAAERFKSRFGFVPPHDWHQWAVMGKSGGKAAKQQYKTYLESHAPHDFWVRVQMRLEFGDEKLGPPQFLQDIAV